MANEVSLVLKVSAAGLKDLVAQSSQFNNNMQAGAKAGGTAGSRKLAAMSENRDYNAARGIGSGSTGSATSDFARQASGLGGLVHVYATFAANLFAVSAAFNALSKAMDNSNLMKGLDQIGAASGRNLSSVAKDMVKVTQGAMSMQDAMRSTALAASSGMSDKDIKRMTEVARNASLALGRDIPDSMDRITKGIAKTQPELLDELGIMARVIPAQQEYAKQLGKSASSLTDFEKRQAFANAVLAEGERKFKNIDLPTNPYSQLLSSIQNLAQSGFEVLNKAIAPVASLLASSPTGLALVLGGIASLLLKQAIPAIGRYNEELRNAAQATANFAKGKADAAKALRTSFLESQAETIRGQQEAIASAKVAAVDAAEAALSKVAKKGIDKTTKQILLDPDLLDTTNPKLKQYLAHLDAMGAKVDKAGVPTKISSTYTALAASIRDAIKAQEDYIIKDKQLRDSVTAEPAKGTREAALRDRADALAKASSKNNIIASAAETASLIGFSKAMQQVKDEVNGMDLKRGEAALLTFRAAVSAATAGIISLGSKLINIFGWIGALVSVFQIMASILTTNDKQIAATTDSFTKLEDSAGNAQRTLEHISKLDPLERMSPESIVARANAMDTLVGSINDAIKSVDAEISSRKWTDSLLASLTGLYGGNAESKLAKDLADATVQVLTLAASDPKLQKARDDILAITKGKSGKSLESGIASGSIDSKALSNRINDLNLLGKQLNATNTDSINSTKNLKRAQDDLLVSFANKDPITDFGTAVASTASTLSVALEDPITNLSAIISSIDSISRTGLMPKESGLSNTVDILKDLRQEYALLIQDSNDYSQRIQNDTNKLNALETARKGSRGISEGGVISGQKSGPERISSEINDVKKSIADLKYLQASVTSARADVEARILKASSGLREASVNAFLAGVNIASSKVREEFAKAAASISIAKFGGAEGTSGGIKAKADAERDLIAVQIQNVRSLLSLHMAAADAADSVALMAAQATIAKAALDAKNTAEKGAGAGRGAFGGMDPQLVEAKKDVKFYETKKRISEAADPTAELERVVKSLKSAISGGDADAVDMFNRLTKLAPEMEKYSAAKGKLAGLEGQKKVVSINEKRELENLSTKEAQESLSKKQDSNVADMTQALNIAKEQNNISNQGIVNSEYNISLEKLNNKYAVDRLDLINKIQQDAERVSNATAAEVSAARETLNTRYKLLDTLDVQRDAEERRLTVARDSSLLVEDQKDAIKASSDYMQLLVQNSDAGYSITLDNLDAQQRSLDMLNQVGLLNADEYKAKDSALKISRAIATAEKDRVDALSEYVTKVNSLIPKLKSTDPKVLADAQGELATANKSLADRNNIIDRSVEATKHAANTTAKWSDDTIALEQAFKSSASTLTDAFFDATQSGKYNFGDMVNSMILDIAKLEFRMQMMKLYTQAVGPSGLTGIIGGFLGGSTGDASPIVAKANGGAFDQGVEAFAKGGAFTNQVVSSPTVFKFAKGTGLMGEAGPEAIMPLKRDANGRLGVANHDGGSSVNATQVVVNNYSGASAEAKETVDSRGQRKIEVTIGNMVAGEIQRAGSAAQQSIKNTFGKQPSLIRR